MELLFVSGIGTVILLATHMIDYALEATRRSVGSLPGVVRNEVATIGDMPVPHEFAEQYDRAA